MKLSNKKFIAVIFLLAIVSAIIWGMPFNKGPRSDARTYDKTALIMMEKGIFNNDDIMNLMIDRVFYPVFLVGVYKIFGHNPFAVKVIQVFIFALLVIVVYKLCQLVFDEQIARLASFATALCYTLAAFTSWAYREIFFTFLIFLLIYCLYRAQLKNKKIWFFTAGAILGLATLTNAIIQFFIFFIIINFLFLNRKALKKALPKLALLCLGFVLVLSPWVVSNYFNFGRHPFPFGSRHGMVLYMKLEKMQAIKGKYIQHFVANTTGDFVAQKLFPEYNRLEARLGWTNRVEWTKMINEEDYSRGEADDELTKLSFVEFFKHPILFLQVSSLDFLKLNTPMMPDIRMQHMFAESESHQNLSDLTKISIIIFIRLVYLIFAIVILYAIIKYIKFWSKIGWIVLVVVYFNLIFSNIHAIARYSLPMYPFYIILLSVGILTLWNKFISGQDYDVNKYKKLIS